MEKNQIYQPIFWGDTSNKENFQYQGLQQHYAALESQYYRLQCDYGKLLDINQQVSQQNSGLLGKTQQLEKKVEIAERKNKRKVVSKFMAIMDDGTIAIVKGYDNGEKEAQPFIGNLFGLPKIYTLRVAGVKDIPDKFGIYFINQNKWIIGEQTKITAKYLFERFIENNIIFDYRVPEKESARILFRYFSPRILESNRNMIYVQGLQGWDESGKKFIHSGNFSWKGERLFSNLPVTQKKFLVQELDEEKIKNYFSEMCKITDWRNRMVIMVFPFAALLSSLMQDEKLGFYLNFIKITDFPTKRICKWLQIFNRGDYRPYNLDISDKNLIQQLQILRDEILIADLCIDQEESDYRKNKMRMRCKMIGKILTNQKSIPGKCESSIDAVFAAISREPVFGEGVVNIWLDEDFASDEEDQFSANAIGAVFGAFVRFFENHPESLKISMRRNKIEGQDRFTAWRILLDVIGQFWAEEKIDFLEQANIHNNLKEINFSEIFSEDVIDEEEMLEVFRKKIRMAIRNYFVAKKEKASVLKEKTLYFSDSWLFFPVKVMRELLQESKLDYCRTKILYGLKRKGIMNSDTEGFSKKVQIGCNRSEMYVIKRQFFERIGEMDIVSLGKWRIGDER